jgi:PiT family inorganic phosphate transporter
MFPKRSIYPKIFTVGLMLLTIWFVESQMIYFDEIKKPSRFGVPSWSVVESHNIKWF